MKNFLLFTFLILFFNKIVAQSFVDKKMFFKITPVPLIDNYYYGLRAGFEYKPIKILGFQAEYQFPIHTWNVSSRLNYHSYQLRFESRFYFHFKIKERGAALSYAATELFFFDKKFDLLSDYYINYSYEPRSFDYANVHQKIFIIALKYGRVWDLSKNFALDFYTGIGIRLYSTNYNTVNDNPSDVMFEYQILPSHIQEGNSLIRPHIALGLKFVYKIF